MSDPEPVTADATPKPFKAFLTDLRKHYGLRAEIDAAHRAPEPERVASLAEFAQQPAPEIAEAQKLARRLVEGLRGRPAGGLVQGLMREYSLSSQEGVALMCLAEALLRIPDAATRDALIADKVGGGEWRAHIGQSPSPFVNAATWGLLITGRLIGSVDERGLAASLSKLIARSGAPIIRASVDTAMRVLGEQFVCGQTIEAALAHARSLEAKGFRYSYDMLGEAALTAEDAERYLQSYEVALDAIGAASAGRGIYEGPGLSVKLSALHPRYSRAQRERVMDELYPRLKALFLRARKWDIGLNIDAEESERLDISLDLLEALCRDPDLQGWNGIGFVIQGYQKRAYFVVKWVIELARATRRRIMVRLVKGAYWDSEIKRAQVEGLADFPVFTRKIHTDVSYLACAKLLLSAPEAAFPQFATHNAMTLAAIHAMAGPNYYAGQYEFQCLHGMGEPLYSQIVAQRPCRIYAPVGSHETLLAYLVRRLLENGANSSFVNRIADPNVPVEALIEDPVAAARRIEPFGSPHPRIALPVDLFGAERANAKGVDLFNEAALTELGGALTSVAPPARRRPCDPKSGLHARCRRRGRRSRRGGRRRGLRARRRRGAGMGRRRAHRARRSARPRRKSVRTRHRPPVRPDRARGGQVDRQRDRRRARGRRFPALLRRRSRARLRQRDAQAARRRRLHQPVEFSDRDLQRTGRRRARRRQRCDRKTSGRDAADCAGSCAAAA